MVSRDGIRSPIMFSLIVIRAIKKESEPAGWKTSAPGKFVGVGAALSLPLKEKKEGYFEDWGYKTLRRFYFSRVRVLLLLFVNDQGIFKALPQQELG
ncbi:hypothetical protein PAMA_018814 [Pampus argenteus]